MWARACSRARSAMDKPFTKTVFSAAGLPQIPYVTVLPWQWDAQRDRVGRAYAHSDSRCSSSRHVPARAPAS